MAAASKIDLSYGLNDNSRLNTILAKFADYQFDGTFEYPSAEDEYFVVVDVGEEYEEIVVKAIWPSGKWLEEVQRYAPGAPIKYNDYGGRLRAMIS